MLKTVQYTVTIESQTGERKRISVTALVSPYVSDKRWKVEEVIEFGGRKVFKDLRLQTNAERSERHKVKLTSSLTFLD